MAAISLTTHIPRHDRPRKMVAAHFREVAAGDDAELGRQRLKQHRDQIGEQHDPEQAVAVSGAGLDVGGEVSGIHIGDRGDDRGPGEHRIAPPAAAASPASTWRAAATVRSDSDAGLAVNLVNSADREALNQESVALVHITHAGIVASMVTMCSLATF